MRWYVYKIDGENVDLILEHNATDNVEWISAEDYNETNTDGTSC